MNRFKKNIRSKGLYALPAAIGSSALIIGIAAPNLASATSSSLAQVTPSQLVSWIQKVKPVPLYGTLNATTSFPIPSASALQGSNPASALSGSTTESYNVWASGSGSFRAQQTNSAGETDLYAKPGSIWLWNSTTQTATKESGPAAGSLHHVLSARPPLSSSTATPQVEAQHLLSALSQFSNLSVSANTLVAGRPAYTLAITPTASDSLIGSIRISVDGQTHVPVQVQIFPKNSTAPAASLGFDTLTFAQPSPSVFSFSPPSGAKVVYGSLKKGSLAAKRPQSGVSSKGSTKVVGKGFNTVVVSSGSPAVSKITGGMEKVLPVISTPVGTAHLYSTPIFQALILPNGTVVAGAVDTARLVQVASTL